MTALKCKIWTLIRGGSFRGYLRTVSGYPLTLTDCMAAPLVSLAVSGNAVQDGTLSPDNPVEVQGVGERTRNLFDVDIIDNTANITRSGDKLLLSGYACTTGLTPEKFLKMTGLKPGDTVTLSCIANIIAGVPSAVTGRISFISKSDGAAWLGLNGTYTIPQNFSNNNYTSMCLYGAQYEGENGERLVEMYDIQILKGSYTAETRPAYEPYGYKVPVRFSGSNHEPQTFNLYLDEPLYKIGQQADDITLNVSKKKAILSKKINFSENPKVNSVISNSSTATVTRFVVTTAPRPKMGSENLCNIAQPAITPTINRPMTIYSGSNAAVYLWVLNDVVGISIDDADSVKISKMNEFLTEHNAKVYYQLATPVVTDISDKIDWDSIPELWHGTVIVTADTEIEPTNITAEYYADKPGGGD